MVWVCRASGRGRETTPPRRFAQNLDPITLRLAATSWVGSLLGALVVAGVLLAAGHRHGEVVIGLSLTTTADGTLPPVLRDTGMAKTSFGRNVLVMGSIAEFGPIILVALLLGGD